MIALHVADAPNEPPSPKSPQAPSASPPSLTARGVDVPPPAAVDTPRHDVRPGLAPREHKSTRLLAMSFDAAVSPSITLRALEGEDQKREHAYGWGFAWYPEEGPTALVVKDPTSIGENPMTKLLRDWERFQSTVFVCHLRGAARTIGEQDTHPFARSFAGRDWVVAHNGDLEGDLEKALPLDDHLFVPMGRTDSERAFCWILTRAHKVDAKRLHKIN
jgi:predicted glutamine amidotransferase